MLGLRSIEHDDVVEMAQLLEWFGVVWSKRVYLTITPRRFTEIVRRCVGQLDQITAQDPQFGRCRCLERLFHKRERVIRAQDA